jgi:hypothetical protein
MDNSKAGGFFNMPTLKKEDAMKLKKRLAMFLALSAFFIFIFGAGNTALAAEEYIYVSCMGNLEFFNAHKFGWKWGGGNGWVSKRRMSALPSMT